MEWRARPVSLAWSNPVVRWWGFLSLVSATNIAIWFALYRQFNEQANGSFSNTSDIGLMFLLCAGYVFGCAFRSVLPRADVQRICLFDTWLSSVFVGRSVATVAEVCFAAQWAIILHQLGTMTGAETVVNIAWMIVPVIIIAECFSWYAVVTTNYLYNAIENSLWAVVFFLVGIALCRLLPEFHGPVRWAFIVAILGIAGFLAFLMTVDVPMYLNRWRANLATGGTLLHPLEGLRDVSRRWVVTHDIAEWREEIAWMSLYFSMAVWSSLALCVGYSLEDQLPRYRTEPAIVTATPAPTAQHTAKIDAAAPSRN
ncbi:hypothetical protein RX327_10170 [Bradyrhizobium sp. BEA-2-5]|uniref:hypothetical protein n=1 Tax=Bradyrhizobium sp. BEA-2-5 TaxID=3080015 RepID=UPI00293F5909|nr:hypothetical protein [Bradyrhizobium sp. BEA-2-5]WOH85240.1 hypothetical protein RX327_10170 [Bradyrhizobium sp. BEA-2-5]